MRLFGRRRRLPDAPPTYWNSSVVERIQRDAGVDRHTAAALWAEMLLFLDMVAASKEFVSPPPPVDVAWHAFILHTQAYESYCRERYGRIIHHQPTGKPDPQAYRRAHQTRSARNTPMDTTIWPMPVAISAQNDDGPRHPGQSGDFAAGAATIGGADLSDRPGGASGDFAPGAGDGSGGGGDFAGGGSGGDFSSEGELEGGDLGGSEPSGGDAGGSGGDSGGSSCGGSSCGSSCGGGSS